MFLPPPPPLTVPTRKNSKWHSCIFLPYSTNIKVDSTPSGDSIEDKLRAQFMSNASIENGTRFMKIVYKEVELLFDDMMRGKDMTSKLQSYLPSRHQYTSSQTGNLRLSISQSLSKMAEWQEYFKNTLRSYKSKRGNIQHTGGFRIPLTYYLCPISAVRDHP